LENPLDLVVHVLGLLFGLRTILISPALDLCKIRAELVIDLRVVIEDLLTSIDGDVLQFFGAASEDFGDLLTSVVTALLNHFPKFVVGTGNNLGKVIAMLIRNFVKLGKGRLGSRNGSELRLEDGTDKRGGGGWRGGGFLETFDLCLEGTRIGYDFGGSRE